MRTKFCNPKLNKYVAFGRFAPLYRQLWRWWFFLCTATVVHIGALHQLCWTRSSSAVYDVRLLADPGDQSGHGRLHPVCQRNLPPPQPTKFFDELGQFIVYI